MAACLNIVVVEDYDDLREATVDALRGEGHHVVGIDCAEALPEETVWKRIDLMIVDLGLPGEDGLALARRVRAAQPGMGLIVVTARNQPRERKAGYDSGADIYMAKPVAFEELLAAVHALGRRLVRRAAGESLLRLDVSGHALVAPTGERISLTATETTVLAGFCRATDARLERWQLMDAIGKVNSRETRFALESTLVRLRKKIRQAGEPRPAIQAVRGWGYQLCVPLQIV